MLLQQMIKQPMTSSQMLVCDPFRLPDAEELVKEVIGLANADVEGPRYILFGVNPGAMDGNRVVGIGDEAMADLKKAHRLLSSLIEPIVHLAFIFDRINNKLVGALEIDGCDEGPYAVGKDSAGELASGQCWIRDGRELREADIADLTPAPEPDESEELIEPPPMRVGFNDDLNRGQLEMDILDSSDPPFVKELEKAGKPKNISQTIKDKVGTMTMQILNLGRAREAASGGNPGEPGTGEHTNILKASESMFSAAQNHYFFEEKALQINLSVCNDGEEGLNEAIIELGIPKLPDFDVADRIYFSPFDKRSQHEVENLGYPAVEHRGGAILVRAKLGVLKPGTPKQAFERSLRLAVGPAMVGKKVAIIYTIRAKNEQVLAEGRLKIVFGNILK
jgi:hypothetical protein